MGGVLLPHLDFILFASIACLAWALIWIFLAPSRRHRLVVSLLLALMLGGGWLLVQRADQRERHRLTSLLEGFAPTYARELQHLGHWMLPMDVAADDPLYLKIIDAELRWLDSNRAIADVYTFRKRADGKVILLVDSETDYDKNGLIEGEREARTQVGEVYEEVTEGIEQAFAGKASFDDVPYEDRWGVWVSALAPIYDPQGRVEGVVGVDYPAESWIAAVAMARLSAIGFTAIILILLLAASVLHCTFSRQLAERGLAQQALMLSHEQLKATNHELARAMLAAESAAHAKSQFLANMSHEIRTPINGILGFADLLMHEDATTTIADRREWLSIIQSSSHHLLELVNDILDSSKIEAGCMTVERIEARPHQILRDVIGIVRPRAMQRNLELKVIQRTPVPEVILSDPLRLRQILLNLAGNAVKFTERGSVVIEMSISLEDGRQLLRFDVIDTGIGMTEDQIRRVFQPFMQADESTTRKYGGTGLGLSIGWNLAHALGGDIKVRSQVGRGTCFTCTIDPGVIDGTRMIQPEESPLLDDGREAATVSGLQGRRILVADDVPTNQKLLKVILDRMKAQVRIASDGRQAVEMAVAERFDLILMDIHMPEMDGMAAAHRMRELGVKCPLLALTAGVSGEEEKRCMESGFNGFVPKPINPAQMMDRLTNILGINRTRTGENPPMKPSTHPDPAASEEAPREPGPPLISTLPADDPVFRSILEEFIGQMDRQIAQMKEAAAADDHAALLKLAHSLKGSGGSVGLPEISEAAMELENSLKDHRMSEVGSRIRELALMARRIVLPPENAPATNP